MINYYRCSKMVWKFHFILKLFLLSYLQYSTLLNRTRIKSCKCWTKVLKTSLHVGSNLLSRGRIIVVGTSNATHADLIVLVHSGKRGHITTYRWYEHEIVRHRFNMSSTFVRNYNSHENFKPFQILAAACRVLASNMKRNLFNMYLYVFECYTTPEEIWRVVTHPNSWHQLRTVWPVGCKNIWLKNFKCITVLKISS
jgi:hypothetical protein